MYLETAVEQYTSALHNAVSEATRDMVGKVQATERQSLGCSILPSRHNNGMLGAMATTSCEL
jgi:hypothetical protein